MDPINVYYNQYNQPIQPIQSIQPFQHSQSEYGSFHPKNQYQRSNGKSLHKNVQSFRNQSNPYERNHPYGNPHIAKDNTKRGEYKTSAKPYRDMNQQPIHGMKPMQSMRPKTKYQYHKQERTKDIRQYQERSKIVVKEETFLDKVYQMCETFRDLQEEQHRRTEMFLHDSLNNKMRQTNLVDKLQALASTNAKECAAKEEAFKCASKNRLLESKSESKSEEGSQKVILNFSKSDDESNSDNDEESSDESDEKSP